MKKPIIHKFTTARMLLAVKLLRISEVEELTGTKKSWIWARVADSTFPPPLKISSRITAWRGADVLNWIESRK